MFNKRQALESKIEELNNEISHLKLENSVYQKYYEKKKAELGPDEDEKKKGRKQKKNLPTTLTLEQKYEIANVVHEDLQAETDSTRKNSEKMVDTLRAVLSETEIRIGELKRDAYEFKRDVVVGAENVRTGKVVAERVIRYFEEKLHTREAVIEKLRLKNASFKSQTCKIEAQLSQKEEIGDVLHYIDFHQLQIENKQYVVRIEERNDELLTVKLSTGKTLQALNELKRKLNEKSAELEWLKSEGIDKQQQLTKLEEENKKILKDVKLEKRHRNRLRQDIEESAEMPAVTDYINQKREMYDLEALMKNWQKKLEILEMTVKASRSTSKVLK